MMFDGAIDRDRLRAGLLTAGAVAALGYALVTGLAVSLPVKPAGVMRLFSLAAPKPPPPREKPPPPHPHRAKREGAAAPPNLKSKATPVVAPPPVVPPPKPPPVVAATAPAIGVNATSGAAPFAGPGTGAGGRGNGFGSGRFGNGEGDGGTPARVIRKLRFGDLRGDVRETLVRSLTDYAVGFRFTVSAAGRVVACAVTRPSGYAALDAATCQAAMEKLRFTPERDSSGRAIPVIFTGTQEWPASRADRPNDPDDD